MVHALAQQLGLAQGRHVARSISVKCQSDVGGQLLEQGDLLLAHRRPQPGHHVVDPALMRNQRVHVALDDDHLARFAYAIAG